MDSENGIGARRGRPPAAKSFKAALDRAIAQGPEKLRLAAEKLLDLAASGESWAIRELADRLDGKPSQSVSVTHEFTEDLLWAINNGVLNERELELVMAGQITEALIARVSAAVRGAATGSGGEPSISA